MKALLVACVLAAAVSVAAQRSTSDASHQQMLRLLADVARQGDETNVFVGEGPARQARANLAALPPTASDATITYGDPATVAVDSAPALLKLTLVIVSPLTNPTELNSLPLKLNGVPYTFVWFCAVMTRAYDPTRNVPPSYAIT